MSHLYGRASAPYRSPLVDRRDSVPTAANKPARSLRRSHFPPVSMAPATSTARSTAMAFTAPPLRPSRPSRPGLLLLGATPAQLPTLKPSQPRAIMGPPAVPNPPPPPPPRKIRSIQSMVFCASLQDHAVWGPVVPLLLAGKTQPVWDKARLSSHDLAVHINCRDGTDISSSTVRFVLVVAGDVGQPDTTRKLQRLAGRKSGEGAVVLFLLSSRGTNDKQVDTMAAYSQLQDELQNTAVSILPMTAVETLPATVAAFCGQLTAAVADMPAANTDRIHNVLRTHFGEAVPLSADRAKKLVAACKATGKVSPRQSKVVLHDVITFGESLKKSGRLEEILGADDMRTTQY